MPTEVLLNYLQTMSKLLIKMVEISFSTLRELGVWCSASGKNQRCHSHRMHACRELLLYGALLVMISKVKMQEKIQRDWNFMTLTFALTFWMRTPAPTQTPGGIAIALLHWSAGALKKLENLKLTNRIYNYCPVVTEKSTNPSVKLTLSMPRLAEAWTS